MEPLTYSSVPDATPAPAASNKSKNPPITSMAASATIVNLLLATGPFGYPFGFVHLGPVIAVPMLLITALVSVITCTYVIECVSTSQAIKNGDQTHERQDSDTLYDKKVYKSERMYEAMNDPDAKIKQSNFFMREKIEFGSMGEILYNNGLKIFVVCVIIIYMYGAMSLKCVSGAESLEQAVSHIIWGDKCLWNYKWRHVMDPYYLGLFLFCFFSCMFSFGDIENSKVIQIVSVWLRYIIAFLLMTGSIVYMAQFGVAPGKVIDWDSQLPYIADVFGNTVFAFIFHHSTAGIVVPMRPQTNIRKMVIQSHIIGVLFLGVEGMLAWMAFGKYKDYDKTKTPCPKGFQDCVIANLYNENFLEIPFIGQVVNFYPFLNTAAMPILLITLRNNLFEALKLGTFLRKIGVPESLLGNSIKVKGFWSFILLIPVFIFTLFYRKPQVILTYTGGLCGTFMLMIFPLVFIKGSRAKNAEQTYGPNPNRSPFQGNGAFYFVTIWATITLISVFYNMFEAGGQDKGDECQNYIPPKTPAFFE